MEKSHNRYRFSLKKGLSDMISFMSNDKFSILVAMLESGFLNRRDMLGTPLIDRDVGETPCINE